MRFNWHRASSIVFAFVGMQRIGNDLLLLYLLLVFLLLVSLKMRIMVCGEAAKDSWWSAKMFALHSPIISSPFVFTDDCWKRASSSHISSVTMFGRLSTSGAYYYNTGLGWNAFCFRLPSERSSSHHTLIRCATHLPLTTNPMPASGTGSSFLQ